MKKLLTLSAITLGIFALAGFVSAATVESPTSPADKLQPASTYYIDDELQVLGTARAYSVRIGAQGYGGVTFFNGTIINETTNVDTGIEEPVTFGDDVRIDGRIWRGATAGAGLDDDRELIVNDDMEVVGDLSVNTGTFTGDITTQGDINQNRTKFGAIKAQVLVTENGDCTASPNYNWTYDDSSISCTHNSEGTYTLTFGFTVNDRLGLVTTIGDQARFATVAPSTTNSRQFHVYTFTSSTGAANDTNFALYIF